MKNLLFSQFVFFVFSKSFQKASTLAEFVEWEVDPAANNFLALPTRFIYL